MDSNKPFIIAFEGIDGSGKSTLAKLLVDRSLKTDKPRVLITPYSSTVGFAADHLRRNRKIIEWANHIGKLHKEAPENVNCVYDRSILTWISQAIKDSIPKAQILDSVELWKPLPDIIFLCEIKPELALTRIKKKDEFADLGSLKRYENLFNLAAEFAERELNIKVIRIDTSRPIEACLVDVNKHLGAKLPTNRKKSKST